MDMDEENLIFTGTCRAGTGVVAAITGYLADRNCYICSLEQFDDESTGKFFLRSVFRLQQNSPAVDEVRQGFEAIAQKFSMDWEIHDPNVAVKTLILVSRYDHCLDDILYRKRKGEFNIDITAVVSNHNDLRDMVERQGHNFIHLPVTPNSKIEQESQLQRVLNETKTELVILARYMQILSSELVEGLEGRCINIHHSFLPGFKGARPYQQAFDRGVKVIGATAHYVTADLDEGPIIEQLVTRVDHNCKPEHLERIGRDNESIALAKAITYHVERRIFLDGNKTVVFLGG
jgi:formyltetrahydrofolate deformylase